MMMTGSKVDRSLPMVVYTPQGGTKKSTLKGCLPPASAGMTKPSSLSLPRRRESRIFNMKTVYSHLKLFSIIKNILNFSIHLLT